MHLCWKMHGKSNIIEVLDELGLLSIKKCSICFLKKFPARQVPDKILNESSKKKHIKMPTWYFMQMRGFRKRPQSISGF
jgi:hypothetical protein